MTAPALAPVPDLVTTAPRLSAAGILRSEWIKLRSVRSTLWCYAMIVLFTVGVGAVVAAVSDQPAGQGSLVGSATAGTMITVLVVAVVGSLIVTGEYGTGQIRSTFSAVPRRTGVLAAKGAVLALTTFVVGLVSVAIAAVVSWAISGSPAVELSQALVVPLVGAALYLTTIALLAFGLGAILRNTAGALATALGLLLVVPVVVTLLGGLTDAAWIQTVGEYLPQSLGTRVMGDGTGEGLGRWAALGYLGIWDAVVLVLAGVLVKRRDV
ncbi:ABC transporter permease [Pseudonocardia ailaonensis]|uniref:ABC transporter permease n=1 Tax=Pseudonocardia ailaonensis TaxID=367279 RepID=A0ABN2MXI8_9PSEU